MPSTRLPGSGAESPTVRISRCALLAALALALTALEALVPLPVPIPGMKLGVANIVTVVAAFWLGPVDAIIVLGVRIVLAAVLTGQLTTLPFSLVGGACALVVTLLFARFAFSDKIRLCTMAAAVAHNVGQMAVAVALTSTPAVALYLPPLLIVGVIAGYLTGTLASTVLERVPQPRGTAAATRHTGKQSACSTSQGESPLSPTSAATTGTVRR